MRFAVVSAFALYMSSPRPALHDLSITSSLISAHPLGSRKVSLEGRWSKRKGFEMRPLNASFDFRPARSKAFALALARRQDEVSGDSLGTNTLREAGRRSLLQLIPYAKVDRDLFASPANRFLSHPNEHLEMREKLLYGKLSRSERLRHFLNDDAIEASLERDWEKFISIRAKSIQIYEENFLREALERFRMNVDIK